VSEKLMQQLELLLSGRFLMLIEQAVAVGREKEVHSVHLEVGRKSMTFVFCTQAVEGGAWNRLMEALEYLCSRGHICHLIAYSNPDLDALRDFDNLRVHEISVDAASRSTLRFTWASYFVLKQIDFSDRERVWCGGFAGNAGLAVGLLKRFSDRSFRMFSFRRGAELERLLMIMERENRSPALIWIKKLIHINITRFILYHSDLLITQTQHGLDTISIQYDGYVPQETAVIPNNINARWITRRIEELENIPSRESDEIFRVCFVGRLSLAVKGLDTLIESAKAIKDLSIEYDVVGSGADEEQVRSLIRKHDLEDNFHLHGWMENPLRVMTQSDLVVVPSRSDPLPNVVLEALALGKPVVGSNVDGIPLMLKYPDLLFKPGDADSLARIIRKAVEEENHIHKLRDLSKKRAERFQFDWGKRFEQIFDFKSRNEQQQ